MDTDRFFAWFLFGALMGWGVLGVGRATMLHRRGMRVLVADRKRTIVQMAIDSIIALCLLLWAYEVIASIWPRLRAPFWPGQLEFVIVSWLPMRLIGAALVLAGLVTYGLALKHLGVSWRMGIDRNAPGPLVTHGIYGWSRHPIYVAFDVIYIGAFLVSGTLFFLLLVLVMFPLLHAMMVREERFLLEEFGDAYRNYSASVGRYCSSRHAGTRKSVNLDAKQRAS